MKGKYISAIALLLPVILNMMHIVLFNVFLLLIWVNDDVNLYTGCCYDNMESPKLEYFMEIIWIPIIVSFVYGLLLVLFFTLNHSLAVGFKVKLSKQNIRYLTLSLFSYVILYLHFNFGNNINILTD